MASPALTHLLLLAVTGPPGSEGRVWRTLQGGKYEFGIASSPTSVVHETVLLLQGDVIGCFLHMPEGGRAFEKEKSVSHTHPYHMPGSALILEFVQVLYSSPGQVHLL